jgi:hypothetical protein
MTADQGGNLLPHFFAAVSNSLARRNVAVNITPAAVVAARETARFVQPERAAARFVARNEFDDRVRVVVLFVALHGKA